MNDQLEDDFFKPVQPSKFRISIPKSFAVALIIVICLQLVASFINFPTRYWQLAFHFLLPFSFLIGGALAIFTLLPFVGTDWKSIKEHIQNPTSIALILLSTLLFIFLIPFGEFTSSIVPTEGNRFLEEMYKAFKDNFEQILNYKIAGFITICILAPIIEEILFRGILLRGLLQNGTSPTLAIVLSSFLFGLAHLNPWQFIGAGFLGAIFGFVYYRTRALWLCMFLHALNNTISFIFLIKDQNVEGSVSGEMSFGTISLFFVIALIIGWFIFKLTQNKPKWI